MIQRHKTAAVVACGVVVALLAGACGNSGSTNKSASTASTTKTSTPASSPGVTPTEVKVDQIVSLTGPNASGEQGFEQGFRAYVEALDARGGVNGRKVVIANTLDDASDPARQNTVFQQAVAQDHPFLIALSSGVFGAADYAIQSGTPVIGTAYANDWYKSDTFFSPIGGSWKAPDPTNLPKAPAGQGGTLDAYVAGKLGITKFGTIGYTVTSSAKAAQNSCDAAKVLGLDCVYTDTSLQFGFTDLGASIAAIKSSGAKLIYAAMDLGGCITIVRSFKRAGMNDEYLICATGYGEDALQKYGPDLTNVFFSTSTAPFEAHTPAMQSFITELANREPGAKPSVTTLNGWISGIFLEDVLKALGKNPTQQGFIDTVRHSAEFSHWNAHNLVSPVDWTTNHWQALIDGTYKPAACGGYLLRADVKNMKWVQVGEKPQLCLGSMNSPAAVKAKLQADTSSLSVSG